MIELDIQERKICKEIIRNPRISDNGISKITNVPLKTVNRKRKVLEEKGILSYAASVDISGKSVEEKSAKQMFIITLRSGISRLIVHEKLTLQSNLRFINIKHTQSTYIGEKDGKISIIMIAQSRTESDMTEILNAEFIPQLEGLFGAGAVHSTKTYRINENVQLLHNYFPKINMKNGIISSNWPDEFIYVD